MDIRIKQKNSNLWFSMGAIVLSLLLIIYIFSGIYLLLKQSINNVKDTAEDLAIGELTHYVDVLGNDELTIVGHSINQLASNMSCSTFEINSVSKKMDQLAKQLYNTSVQTQESMEKQNQELIQATTAISQISTSISEITDKTIQANDITSNAMSAAESGKQVVQDTIGLINHLSEEVKQAGDIITSVEQDSKSISTILDTIQGIAEQTNLLALNAAIEAARAGEQGRGFAVVADEVRTLAQRTQEATLAIKELISRLQNGTTQAVSAMESSSQMVGKSVEQAQQAGDSLNSIVDIVADINTMSLAISDETKQQTKAAQAIDNNLLSISNVSNSTMKEVTLSVISSYQVSAISAEIQGLLNQYNIDEKAVIKQRNSSDLIFKWDDSFRVGIDEIDRQHQRLFTMVNNIYRLISNNSKKEALLQQLDSLINYTVTHFGLEELLFDTYGYDDVVEHKAKHKKLVKIVSEFRSRAEHEDINKELMDFLLDWLKSHIKGTDTKYGPFLRENGFN